MKVKEVVLALGLATVAVNVSASYGSAHDQVQQLFQSDQEPTAKDAVWTQNDIFKVGLIDNGQSRDGYASYVCQVLYDYGFKGKSVWVQAIDISRLIRDGDWVKLGEAQCQ